MANEDRAETPWAEAARKYREAERLNRQTIRYAAFAIAVNVATILVLAVRQCLRG